MFSEKSSVLKKILFWGVITFFIVMAVIGVCRTLKGSTDFDTFYMAGKSVLQGTGIYYQDEYYKDYDAVAPFLYPPVAAIFFALFAVFPLIFATLLWYVLLLGCLFFCYKFSVTLLTSWHWHPKRIDFSQMPKIGFVFILAIAAFAIDNLIMLQMNIWVLFLMLTALVFLKKKRMFLAGLILSLAISMKVTPVFFVLYLLAKKQWKVLSGCFVGGMFLILVLPTIVFGVNQNRVYHRQWVGRTLKPMLIETIHRINPEKEHPRKKSPAQWKSEYLANLLTASNQSLQAASFRLFLKDRNEYAFGTSYPIHAARRYQKMPVIGGGLSIAELEFALQFVKVLMLGSLFFLLMWKRFESESFYPLEISIMFLSLTLFSPLARSHQFIYWLFPIMNVLFVLLAKPQKRYSKFLISTTVGVCFLYFSQILPYGKAVGMGAWSNLLFWSALFAIIFREKLALVNKSFYE